MKTEEAIRFVLEALREKNCLEFSCGGGNYLIQPENNKGWDYLCLWRTAPTVECLGRAMFELLYGVDEEAVRELMEQPCISGKSLLELCGEDEIIRLDETEER